MARIAPFRALRPAPDVAERVAAVPYDVVSADEARALAAGNPDSFLHVSRAEIDLPPGTDPYAAEVYDKAVENFRALKARAPLVMEDEATVYIYQLRLGAHVQTGVAAAFSLDEYERDTIRKHEHTRRDKEDDRTQHMIALRAQTGPVFLTYRASAAVDAAASRIIGSDKPLFDFTAADDVRHSIWRLDAAAAQRLTTAFEPIPALYIADGHHRAASAARARAELGGPGRAAGPWDTFLGVAFADNQVQVLPYNRVVKDLGGLTPEALLDRLRHQLSVQPGPAAPERRGDASMFLDGRWYSIALGEPAAASAAADRLDVSRLQDAVLGPILGIGDIRSDKRIDFVGGARGTGALEKLVSSGQAAVAFSLYPVSVHDLMTISDAGGIMPPKSTWFEPKLRDGLLSHVI